MLEGNGLPRLIEVHPRVLHEAIDGEVIAIDLDTGTYYSLRGSAASAWEILCRHPGVSEGEVGRALARLYRRSADDVAAPVGRFLEELWAEGLIREADGVEAASLVAPNEDLGDPARPPEAFGPPRLEKFTDMQDLVLLDPVHDVGATGWPHLPPDGTRQTSRA